MAIRSRLDITREVTAEMLRKEIIRAYDAMTAAASVEEGDRIARNAIALCRGALQGLEDTELMHAGHSTERAS